MAPDSVKFSARTAEARRITLIQLESGITTVMPILCCKQASISRL